MPRSRPATRVEATSSTQVNATHHEWRDSRGLGLVATSHADALAWAGALGADPSDADFRRAHAAAVAHYEVAPLVHTRVGAGV